MKKQNKNLKGFTLIEMLVVVSIIGILSSFAVVSLNSARAKARDALRKGDTAQIRTALNLYYDDNGHYPSPCGTFDLGRSDFGATIGDTAGTGSNCYLTVLSSALTAGAHPLMLSLPRDPRNNDNLEGTDPVYIYRYVSDVNGNEYALVYTLEEGGMQVIRGW